MNTSHNTILITGGATGIGYALAEEFLGEGNEVIICGRRARALQAAKEKLPALHTIVCDVEDEQERARLVSEVTDNFPAFNILVNNAGIQQMIRLQQSVPSAIIAKEVMINLIAPIHLTTLVAPHFTSKKEAAIVNITSGLGFVPIAWMPVYCATKAAMHSFSTTSRHQLNSTSIKVFEIIPPTVETELDHGRRKASGRQIEMIQPGEVATETLEALKVDQFECAIGQAANLVNAVKNGNAEIIFERMN